MQERRTIHPPLWLVGSWKGQPGGAIMRLDSDGVAIRLVDSFRYRVDSPSTRTLGWDTPIHANAGQISKEGGSTGPPSTYYLITQDNVRLDAKLQSDGTVLVEIESRRWLFSKQQR